MQFAMRKPGAMAGEDSGISLRPMPQALEAQLAHQGGIGSTSGLPVTSSLSP